MMKKVTRTIQKLDVDTVKSNPLAVVFIVFSFIVIYYASQFPSGDGLGAGFFPIVISAGIIVFAIADLFVDGETEFVIGELDFTSPAVIAVLLAGYVALMPITGFLVGTMAFLPIVLYYSAVRSIGLIASISIGFPIVLFYVFSRIFMVRLPEGVIPISRLLPELPLLVI